MVGGSVWLDRGDPVRATVNGKFEEIQYSMVPQGAWYRMYRVGVVFTTATNASGSATVSVPQERYDQLQPGDTLSIRYLSAAPIFARTVDRSTFTVLRDLGQRAMTDHVLAPLLLWLGAGAVALYVASLVSTPVIFATGLAWIGAGFPLLLPPPRPVVLSAVETSGRIVAISLVDRAPERRTSRRRLRYSSIKRLAVPYQVVQFNVARPGRTDSVLAVDAVDSGSTPGLAHGAILPIRLDTSAPRDSRLAEGRRSFMTRNRYHFRMPVVGCGILGTLGAWGWRDRRRRRARTMQAV
jgi:hypothetical protein